MSEIFYLDNSATTKPCDEAVEAINIALKETWGNPSSLHSLGMEAEQAVFSCKEVIAKKLSCRADEIYFTGSGTEANNIAILGAAEKGAKRGKRIVTTAIEHPSVTNTVKSLEAKGFEIVYMKPDGFGKISPQEISRCITADTVLVSMMLINNEIGSIQPIAEAAAAIKRAGAPALLHCDAVQGFGKLDIKPAALGIDLMTASGHKIHAPKGIGFLYIKKGVHISPTIFGGGQQNGIRPGTEPVPAIAALSAAVKALPDTKTQLAATGELWEYAKDSLLKTGFVEINSPDDALPYVLNVSVPGYRSETLLHFLEAKNIYVSSGSACAKGDFSPTLTAMGLSKARIDSALRISFSRFNTKDDIDRLCEVLSTAVEKLRRTK